jgi:hypothetical protein
MTEHGFNGLDTDLIIFIRVQSLKSVFHQPYPTKKTSQHLRGFFYEVFSVH